MDDGNRALHNDLFHRMWSGSRFCDRKRAGGHRVSGKEGGDGKGNEDKDLNLKNVSVCTVANSLSPSHSFFSSVPTSIFFCFLSTLSDD